MADPKKPEEPQVNNTGFDEVLPGGPDAAGGTGAGGGAMPLTGDGLGTTPEDDGSNDARERAGHTGPRPGGTSDAPR